MRLARLISDDMNQAVTCLVLATNTSTNVSTDADEDHGQVLD